jgi:hypothetical protein
MRPTHPVISAHGENVEEARAKVAFYLNEIYEAMPPYKPNDIKIVQEWSSEVDMAESAEEEFNLTACPYCANSWSACEFEDNEPIGHAICKECDITFSWDDTGWWIFDRLCSCGRPAVLNVSNGLFGCLDLTGTCTDSMTDELSELDYEISGYRRNEE